MLKIFSPPYTGRAQYNTSWSLVERKYNFTVPRAIRRALWGAMKVVTDENERKMEGWDHIEEGSSRDDYQFMKWWYFVIVATTTIGMVVLFILDLNFGFIII